ncbi:MAG TPA: ATP-binding protein [Candidatus Sulfotelmatobacter sp.]|nr:ATP-binding protein [Candidatus Sulfotelmatobacter sp.]
MSLTLEQTFNPKDEQLEHERLISLINSMADAVIAIDENTNIVLFNSAALNILDINNIALQTPIRDVFNPIDKDYHPADIDALIKSATMPITNRDLRLSYKDGSLINLFISIAPVHLGYGEKGQKGFVIVLRDITREKSLEEERDEFISVVSHELRTPITIAEGNISNAQFVMNQKGQEDAIKKALEEAHNQVLFLADMINDLSTLSRAERGKLQVEVENINVSDLAHELVESYKADASKKGLELKAVVSPEIHHLFSSRLYVREMLQNLVTNAIKYTDKGEVVIHAEPKDQGVILSVHDTGIGISKPDQEKVFEKFFRSEDYRTRKSSGTGLGLYVTHKLANLIQAQITLSSELNKGSTFSIYIPNLKKESA